MEEFVTATFANSRYFERLGKVIPSLRYEETVRPLLPVGWSQNTPDYWVEFFSARSHMPDQGFKVHISSSIERASELLAGVVPIICHHESRFKVIADRKLHVLSNSKRFPRGAAGKFITVYPQSSAVFVSLLEDLAGVTESFDGPYILSDRRYKQSRVLFYRYGGFKSLTALQLDGTKKLLMKGPTGDAVDDVRNPFFELPSGVSDPFEGVESEDESSGLLNGRYRVESALNFTSTGGVYTATDLQSTQTVVIKEARPLTLMIAGASTWKTATRALEHERNVLETLRNQPYVPRFIDFFTEWEHSFLVESFVAGVPLAQFRAKDDFIIMERLGKPAELERSCAVWKLIAVQLIEALNAIHLEGVVLGDLSPVNVLIDPVDYKLTIIDVETAHIVSGDDPDARFNSAWAFPGFRSSGRRDSNVLNEADDWYACGMLLYNLICPVQNLFDLDRDKERLGFLDHFVNSGLPVIMADVIRSLLVGNVAQASACIQGWDPDNHGDARSTYATVTSIQAILEHEDEHRSVLQRHVEQLCSAILASSTLERSDRLWPSDPKVFNTNPLHIEHGAAGTAYFLYEALGFLPDAIRDWVLKQPVDNKSYPPGLYTGTSGIAWFLSSIGEETRAVELMKQVQDSPLAFSACNLFEGAAGWGLAALQVFGVTDETDCLKSAERAANYILQQKVCGDVGVYWESPHSEVRLGMGYGNSGIATFLLEVWRITQRDEYLQCAVEAMDFEVSHGRADSDGALLFGPSLDANVHSPYWLRGSGGVATALTNFYRVLNDKHYLELAKRAAIPSEKFFSAAPHMMEGLASMGGTLLDLYGVTGDTRYYAGALRKALQTTLYQVSDPNGIAYPGRFLLRVSHDLSAGGAGIGLFFDRLLNGKQRAFNSPVRRTQTVP